MTPYELGRKAAFVKVANLGEDHPYFSGALDSGIFTANKGHKLKALGHGVLGALLGGLVGHGALGSVGGHLGAVAGGAVGAGDVIKDSYSTKNKIRNLLGVG